MTRMAVRGLLTAFVFAIGATSASAQPFGTFTWQMQPYRNQVTLTLTSVTGNFTLDGSDDQCGATTKASANGIGVFNPNGTVGLNFTIVTSPGGKPVHVSALVSPANGQGTWSDSVGNSGTFAFFGAVPGLPVRPLPASGLPAAIITTIEIAPGAVGASDINTAEVQARVAGTCAAGEAMSGVNANGTVTCIATFPRVVRTCSAAGATVSNTTTTTQTLAAATIVAPGPGNLVAIFEGAFFLSGGAVGTAIQAEIGLNVNSTAFAPLSMSSRLFVFQQATGTPFVDVRTETTSGSFQVVAGTYTVNALIRHSVSSGAASVATRGNKCVTLFYVERGGSGGIPGVPALPSPSGDR